MKFVNEKQMIMTTNLLSNTATLIVRIPGYVEIPAYQEKSRAKRTIIRTLIRSLQLKDLELVYAGQFPEDALAGASAANSDGTLGSKLVRADNLHQVHVHVGRGINVVGLSLAVYNGDLNVGHFNMKKDLT